MSPSSSEQEGEKNTDKFAQVITKCPPDLQEIVGNEVFLLSVRVIKYNKYFFKNTRFLTLTQENILIVKQKNKTQKELRLKLALDSLKGITISLHPNSSEMVIHAEF